MVSLIFGSQATPLELANLRLWLPVPSEMVALGALPPVVPVTKSRVPRFWLNPAPDPVCKVDCLARFILFELDMQLTTPVIRDPVIKVGPV